ncbi:GerAB/ArcD/ProY family transporter [Pontibacillus marinus]|nr:endospore germination permease [Pontibacillus marinus]
MDEKINVRQFTLLLTLFTIGTSVLITPSQLATLAKESAWIAASMSVFGGLLVLLLYLFIGHLQPHLNLFQHNEYAFGKWLGKLFTLIIVLFSLIGASTVLWTVGDFVIVQVIPETPLAAICILFMTIIVYGTKLGIETIVKTVEIFFPWIIMLLTIIVLFSIPSMDIKQLQPLWGQPISKVVEASIYELSISTFPLILLFVLYPSVLNPDSKGTRSILLGYLFAEFLIMSITVIAISVLGYKLTSHYVYPTYVMAERIEFIVLLDRLEVVIAISWILSIFFKLFIYFYISLIGISQLLGLKHYRPVTIPMGIIVIGLALIIYPDSIFAGKWNKETWVPLSIIIGVVYPIVLLCGSKIKSILRRNHRG